MCIATVYISGIKKEIAMQDIVSISSDNDSIVLTSLLGETKSLKAKLTHIDFLKHTVILELN